MLIVVVLLPHELLLLHVSVLFTPWRFRFWQKGHYFFLVELLAIVQMVLADK
jgi:hypothetical protein